MRINLNTVKTGILATSVALATASCRDRVVVDKVKEEALRYIPELGVVDANRSAAFYSATGTNPELADKVYYWDSISSQVAIGKAYQDGKSYALRKYNGDKTAKPNQYRIDYNTRDIEKNGSLILKKLRLANSAAKSSGESLRMRSKEPDYSVNSASTPSEIVFWNGITTAYKCREAFKKGIAFAKDSISNAKLGISDTVSVCK